MRLRLVDFNEIILFCNPSPLGYHENNLMECNGIDKIVHGRICLHNQEKLFLLDYLCT